MPELIWAIITNYNRLKQPAFLSGNSKTKIPTNSVSGKDLFLFTDVLYHSVFSVKKEVRTILLVQFYEGFIFSMTSLLFGFITPPPKETASKY